MQGKRASPANTARQADDTTHNTSNLDTNRLLTTAHLQAHSSKSGFARWWGSSLTMRAKTFLIILTALLGFLLTLVLPVRTFLLDSFARLETDQLITDFDRARNAFDTQIDAIARVTRDYAAWDETYEFADSRDPNYLENNITAQLMQNFRLNLVAIYDRSGALIAERSYDYTTLEPQPLTPFFARPEIAQDPLLNYTDELMGNRGIILLPEGPLLVASYPILTDAGQGPSRGSLIMGRFLRSDTTERLASTTRLDVAFEPVTEIDSALVATLGGSDMPVVTQPHDGLIMIRGLLNDIYGQPALMVSITDGRTIYNRGSDAVSYLIAVLVAIVVAIVVLALLMIERVMLSRMARLNAQVIQIGASGNPLARLTIDGQDEIAQMGRAINGMLEALENASQGRKETEAGYRAVVEQTAESVFLVDPATGYFIETNAAFRELLGYTEAEMANRTIYDVVATEGPEIDSYIRDVLSEGHSRLVERRYLRKDGTPVDVEESSATIRREGSYVLCFLAHDLTERRQAEEERARRKSEERFRAMVQNAADVITIINPDGSIRYQSPSIEHMLGFKTGNLVGMSVFDNLHPADADTVRAMLVELVERPSHARRSILRIRHMDQSWRFVEIVATNHLRDSNVGGIILNMRDITERKALEERLIHQASHDPLTSLPNRTLFAERLGQALKGAADSGSLLAVMFIDLDNFKLINDSLGHQAGDVLLIEVAGRLRESVRPFDLVSRFGGDEFTLLLEDLQDAGAALAVAERIQRNLQAPFIVEQHEISIACCVGVAFNEGDIQPDELIRNADIAVYRAKASGKARITVFDKDMNQYALKRLELEIDLRRAIDRNELIVFYQPVLDLLTGDVAAIEALVRWQDPRRGLVSPLEFIALAEETALIMPLGRWVLTEACTQTQIWKQMYRSAGDLTVCVNVSARQFRHKGLVADVARALDISGLPPSNLKLEITETVGIEDPDTTLETLRELKALGVKLALDDFGVGYSSLSYLKRFPVDTIKLDRSFVSGLGLNRQDTAVVYAAISFAKALRLNITAEGIETKAQVEQLRALGCEQGQGYYFSMPLPPLEMGQFLKSHDPSVQTLPLANATRTAL
jgi:diguanylate cyclase (GGDEF)-like protein/PAS domain S-box-containing protein